MSDPVFMAHNIRLEDGSTTLPTVGYTIDQHPHFVSAKRLLSAILPEPRGKRLIDLGCNEGGYAVEFARLGFDVLGIEVREANIAACDYVQRRLKLPNLRFARDDAWNLAHHGAADVIFCCGLLYHLDRPAEFIRLVGEMTRTIAIFQTHFAADNPNPAFHLSEPERDSFGYWGRWAPEFVSEEGFCEREQYRWSSWDNRRAFWLRRDCLLQAILDAGFSVCLEQFDQLEHVPTSMQPGGVYRDQARGSFIGIKALGAARASNA